MTASKSKRFTWDKPVVKPAATQESNTLRRLRENRAVRPAKSHIQAEYDAVKRKRKGEP